MTRFAEVSWEKPPLVLLVPGLHDSGPDHWQSHWARDRTDCERVELGMWDKPHRNTWVNKLNLAIRLADRPIVLVAHSLGCHAVAWWAEFERPATDGPVVAAILIAPPEVDGDGVDGRIAGFGPAVASRLPFTSIVAASRDDPFMAFGRAEALAEGWGSRFIDLGRLGHVNADSGIGAWTYGQYLLDRVIYSVAPVRYREWPKQPPASAITPASHAAVGAVVGIGSRDIPAGVPDPVAARYAEILPI